MPGHQLSAKVVVTAKQPDSYGLMTSGVTFGPDYADGANASWAARTPTLDLTMSVVDDVAQHIEQGARYTLLLTPDDPADDDQLLTIDDTRSPAVLDYRDRFGSAHLPPGVPHNVMDAFRDVAQRLVDELPDSSLLVHGLHGLWKAKNEAVLAAVRIVKSRAADGDDT